ncbi:MAG: lytic transglycosylase [Hyphomicrobiales bacterium]|nr:MAG: lytic transglycosylase [Hyphomicrobiales bacterium]
MIFSRVFTFFSSNLFAALIAASLFMPVQAKADGFDQWVRDFWPTARAKGVSPNIYNAAFAGVTIDKSILRSAGNQAEFVRAIWSYLDSATSDNRVNSGREMLSKHKRTLDAIEGRYGVDRHIVVAIWGMESNYGKVLNNPKIVKNVIRSLATLAYADKRRRKFGRSQLVAALLILERGDTTPAGLTGSWAGAMGHTQFIPTTYQAYAVDFDGDGRRNIWTSIPDALGSTAAYLNKMKWNTGKTWGYEVQLSKNFNFELAHKKSKRTLGEWQNLGVSRTHGRNFPRPSDSARLFVPAGANGPAFLLLKNFRVIKRYNNADAYALAVGHLSDRLRGGNKFAKKWPRNSKPLNRKDRKSLQTLLRKKGFYNGSIDGKLGPVSRAAIRRYQSRLGMVADGYASSSILSKLRGG